MGDDGRTYELPLRVNLPPETNSGIIQYVSSPKVNNTTGTNVPDMEPDI